MMRLGALLIAALVGAAGGAFAYHQATQEAEEPAVAAEAGPPPERGLRTASPVQVQAVASEARPLANQIILRGITEAVRKVEIRAQTSGLVTSAPRSAGTAVRAGEVLCEIEAGGRGASLAEARATLERAEADARASERLNRRGFSADNTVAADAAALEAARAMVARMELDVARTTIRAPFDGRLESDAAETGALLDVGATCATLVALDPIKVVGFAPERVVDQITPGLIGSARLINGERFDAEVSFVARTADPATRTYRVEARAPNADEALRDGMTAELTLPLAEDRAHLLPASALTLNEAGALGVRVVADDPQSPTGLAAAFVPATLLRDTPEGVWLSGLPERTDVIIVGQEFVTAGAPVTVGLGAPAAGEDGGA